MYKILTIESKMFQTRHSTRIKYVILPYIYK